MRNVFNLGNPPLYDQGLHIRRETLLGVPMLQLSGEMDVASTPELSRSLGSLCEKDGSFVVGLGSLTSIDAGGAHSLLEAQQRLQRRGDTLVLASPRRVVQQVMIITELDRYIPTCPTDERAANLALGWSSTGSRAIA